MRCVLRCATSGVAKGPCFSGWFTTRVAALLASADRDAPASCRATTAAPATLPLSAQGCSSSGNMQQQGMSGSQGAEPAPLDRLQGWASVGDSPAVYKMCMSIGWNPVFQNKVRLNCMMALGGIPSLGAPACCLPNPVQ